MEFAATASLFPRASLSGTAVNWTAGDELCVFANGNPYKFDTRQSGPAVFFAGAAEESSSYDAVYPYARAESWEGGVITTFLPCNQKGWPGQFDPDAALCVTRTTGSSLVMRPVGGLVSFVLKGERISQVAIAGNDLEPTSGQLDISFNGAIPSATFHHSYSPGYDDGHRAFYTELGPKLGKVLPEGRYYIHLAPQRFQQGIRAVLSRNDGCEATLASHGDWEMKRGELVDLGTIDAGALDWEYCLPVRFVNCVRTQLWPFSEGRGTMSSSVQADALAKVGWKSGQRLSYTLSGSQLPVVFCSSNCLAYHPVLGIRFGNAVGDYLELPAVEGRTLVRVLVCTTDSGESSEMGSGNPAIVTSDGALVPGGDAWTGPKRMFSEHSWNLSGTQPGTPYRIALTATRTCALGWIKAYYSNNQ